ncbi:ankyrin repeat-containing domain protein [Syncephalis pseudoplumigaleata]|uniref:Ankyrin repeat-containing domain protein n=1 Tax=Syncephalis pseudoplumigaleata TaxID=1712513 RepID=A0A4P9YVD7_9FUNG|nr:ankyrin repeat-containing domain protein [Syncephalis pseudoplumigaleata]|eukprot:RKP22880.1 ankyrin repeat-containing domain protein [Syncephalis pseudoplumigaleata]
MAASYDHLDACRLLVERGASTCLQDAEGWTPLHCAAAEGHLRVVTYLLGEGVDATLVNADGETAADVAEEDRVRSVLHAST